MRKETSTEIDRIDLQAPLTTFADCHQGITSQLNALAELPALLEPARRAHWIAADTVYFFEHVVLAHHAEEEAELFPAVLRASAKGPERDRMKALVDRLVQDHRAIEAQWKELEPQLAAVAKGAPAEVGITEVRTLLDAYLDHARFEEQQFLPLCEQILGRKESNMSALGLSLHMRRRPVREGF